MFHNGHIDNLLNLLHHRNRHLAASAERIQKQKELPEQPGMGQNQSFVRFPAPSDGEVTPTTSPTIINLTQILQGLFRTDLEGEITEFRVLHYPPTW